jgi:hypothetical protein
MSEPPWSINFDIQHQRQPWLKHLRLLAKKKVGKRGLKHHVMILALKVSGVTVFMHLIYAACVSK